VPRTAGRHRAVCDRIATASSSPGPTCSTGQAAGRLAARSRPARARDEHPGRLRRGRRAHGSVKRVGGRVARARWPCARPPAWSLRGACAVSS
jgi:hypothetical protein